MRNAGLDEAQAGIKISGRNINNLRYADDTTLMAESEGELKSLLIKVKEKSEKAGLKLNVQKTKIMASVPSLHGKYLGKQCKQWQTLFWGLQNHCRWWCMWSTCCDPCDQIGCFLWLWFSVCLPLSSWGLSFALGRGVYPHSLQHLTAAASVPTILLGLLCPWTWGISQLQISHRQEDPPKRDFSHPKNSPACYLRSCRVWMFFPTTVGLYLTSLEVLPRNKSHSRWLKSLLVKGSRDLSSVCCGVQPLPSCAGSLELSWEILSPET